MTAHTVVERFNCEGVEGNMDAFHPQVLQETERKEGQDEDRGRFHAKSLRI